MSDQFETAADEIATYIESIDFAETPPEQLRAEISNILHGVFADPE